VWRLGLSHEREKLASCYKNSLELAEKHGVESIAFPLISSGAYGYPKDKAVAVAIETIAEFLQKSELDVYLVFFDKDSFKAGGRLVSQIKQYIDDHYADERCARFSRRMKPAAGLGAAMESVALEAEPNAAISELFENLDESFSEMLLRKIDEKGMTDVECYKKANISRKVFSKIRVNRDYRPNKNTAIAFAIALELNLTETADFLRKAGYALSGSNKFDVIIEYFIKNRNYNIFEINEALFYFDQSLLGAVG
jgi:hypothetical protein